MNTPEHWNLFPFIYEIFKHKGATKSIIKFVELMGLPDVIALDEYIKIRMAEDDLKHRLNQKKFIRDSKTNIGIAELKSHNFKMLGYEKIKNETVEIWVKEL